MDLRKISYFVCIAESLNFSKAAEKLHISHQALSRQIQLLEEDLGVRLFERSRNAVSLTEAGRKMYLLLCCFPGGRISYNKYNNRLNRGGYYGN